MKSKKVLRFIVNIINLEIVINITQKIRQTRVFQNIFTDMATFGLKILYPDKYNHLLKNKKYHNIFEGKRCFILGNGPSLNDIDFEYLSDEIVFTTNHIMVHPEFGEIKSNFHLCIDMGMFGEIDGEPAGYSEVVQKEMDLLEMNNVKYLILPLLESERYVEMYHLDEHFEIIYVFSRPWPQSNPNLANNFTKATSEFINVVHYAINIAIFMGFKEIYLLGCDGTLLNSLFSEIQGKCKENIHCYGILESEEKSDEFYASSAHYVETCLRNYTQYYKSFGYIAEYCRKNNIEIYNLSPTSLILSIPKKDVGEIIF